MVFSMFGRLFSDPLKKLERFIFRRKYHLTAKRMERKDWALEKIAYTHAHELRGPLTSILGLIALLKMADDDDNREEYLILLEQAAGKLDVEIQGVIAKVEKSRG